MKISIDLDGTLWHHMSLFRGFMGLMQAAGHEVGILTGHHEHSQGPDVALMIARGFPEPSFYLGKTDSDMNQNGAVSKSRLIVEAGIDAHFDDLDYGNPETERLFAECLGPNLHRLIVVRHKEPHLKPDGHGIHYE